MRNTGIILAGGKSKRMGQDKAFMDVNGKAMIQHVIDNIKPLCNQILISANQEEYKKFNYPVIKDIIKDAGPAGGIISCLQHSLNRKNIIIPCDMPYASMEFLERLLRLSTGFEITVPKAGKMIQPLCGIYLKDVYYKFKTLVEEGEHTLQHLLKHFKIKIIAQEHLPDIDLKKSLRNVNNLSDLERNTL
jgi:molybdopterin-guanine dinucleotide biosynthesis protein A